MKPSLLSYLGYCQSVRHVPLCELILGEGLMSLVSGGQDI